MLGSGEWVEGVIGACSELGCLAQSGECVHGLLGVVVHGDADFRESLSSSNAFLTSDEASDDRLSALGDLLECADDGVGDLHGLGDCSLAVEDGDCVAPVVLEGDLEAILVSLEASSSSDVDWVLWRSEVGHALEECFL